MAVVEVATFADPIEMRMSRLVLLLFLTAQACDGIFTYLAVGTYGVTAEGNVLLATWMWLIGPTPALIGAKLLATCCGILLYVRGVHRTLAFLTVLYAVGAVGPWMLLFSMI